VKNELKRRLSFQLLSIKYLLFPKHWTISYWQAHVRRVVFSMLIVSTM